MTIVEHCGLRFEQEPPANAPVMVIHAMPLRDRYREQYEETKKWRM